MIQMHCCTTAKLLLIECTVRTLNVTVTSFWIFFSSTVVQFICWVGWMHPLLLHLLIVRVYWLARPPDPCLLPAMESMTTSPYLTAWFSLCVWFLLRCSWSMFSCIVRASRQRRSSSRRHCSRIAWLYVSSSGVQLYPSSNCTSESNSVATSSCWCTTYYSQRWSSELPGWRRCLWTMCPTLLRWCSKALSWCLLCYSTLWSWVCYQASITLYSVDWSYTV